MVGWFTRRRRMVGGLYFGQPGWGVERIEGLGEAAKNEEVRVIPAGRAGFAKLLEEIGLLRTSGVTPGLLEQMAEIGERDIRAIVLNLLPTQPEFAMGPGLSKVALAEMMAGLLAIQGVVKARRVMVVGDRHDWRTRRLWRRAIKAETAKRRLGDGANGRAVGKKKKAKKCAVELKGVLNQYPQAHPTLLLRRLFGKQLPVGRLPVRVNRLIVDPATCWALGRWVLSGEKFTARPVQLFGRTEKAGSAQMVMARLGETIAALCERYDLKTAGMQVVVNGMLAGEEVDAERALVECSTESVSVRDIPLAEHSTPCFSCGWCVDVCPTELNPVNLLMLAEEAQRGGGAETPVGAAELRSGEARESMHCIGCGLCSYVCPTRLPLMQRTLRLRGWVVGEERADAAVEPAMGGKQ